MVKEDENRSWDVVRSPIKGCKFKCDYCYMHKQPDADMEPRFESDNLRLKGSQIVFVGGAGDAWGNFIKSAWIRKVLEQVKRQQHKHDFMFCTKNPKRYAEFELPLHAWYGTTYDGTEFTQKNIDLLRESATHNRFVSFEPLIEEPKDINLAGIRWVIIGADLTEGASKPSIEWAKRIVALAKEKGIPVWINDSYNYPEKFKEYPADFISLKINIIKCGEHIVKCRHDCGLLHLSISRLDNKCIHDWRVLQEIKNLIAGEDREAVEIYPAESRVLDARNSFHLWVLPKGQKVPFGFQGRHVVTGLANQRPFGNLKVDCIPIAEVRRRIVYE